MRLRHIISRRINRHSQNCDGIRLTGSRIRISTAMGMGNKMSQKMEESERPLAEYFRV